MPWAAGVYTRGYPSWSSDAASNLPISATKFDTEDNDFASGLNNCLTKDGLSGPNTPLTWSLSNGQILQLTRGSDGNVFGIARTGGATNPSFKFSIADSGGLSISSGTGNFTISNTGNLSVSGNATLTPNTAVSAMILNPPISQIGLQVNGFSADAARIALIDGNTGNRDWQIRSGGAGTGFFDLYDVTSAASRLTISTQGQVSISAPTSGNAFIVNAIAGAYAALFIGSATAGSSLGLLVQAGTTAADAAITVQNQAGTATFLQTLGSGRTIINDNATGNGLTLNSTLAAGGYLQWQGSGTGVYYAGSGNALDGGNASDFVMRSQAAIGWSTGGANRRFTISAAGGMFAAAATGGDQGVGTINAVGLYLNGGAIYSGVPVNGVAGAYTTVASDANRCVKQTTSGTLTIASNASVAYPLGTVITFANRTGSPISIAINADTLQWSANNTGGTRSLASNGMATAIKTDATIWLISGAGLS